MYNYSGDLNKGKRKICATCKYYNCKRKIQFNIHEDDYSIDVEKECECKKNWFGPTNGYEKRKSSDECFFWEISEDIKKANDRVCNKNKSLLKSNVKKQEGSLKNKSKKQDSLQDDINSSVTTVLGNVIFWVIVLLILVYIF